MNFDPAQIPILLAPPIIGGVIGYFTNDLAIKMLFRPYRAIYLWGRKLPFTPGLIPSNQERLAQRIADTIMGSLLTPEELQNLARRLLSTDRIKAAIFWLLNLALDQIQGANDQKVAKIFASILRDIFGDSLPKLIKSLARQDDFLEPQFNQIFDQVLLDFQFNDEQAEQLSAWLLTVVLPPDALRQAIVDFLTDRNIRVIDESFREKASGTYWVVANLFGLRNTLVRLRTYCLDEREASNKRLAELIRELSLQQRLQEWVQNLSMQNLPVFTVRQLRKNMHNTLRVYIQKEGADLLQGLSASVQWEQIAMLLLNRLRTSDAVTDSLTPVSKELALILERYLERDLEELVARTIPILNIDQVIIDRVNATPPRNLETNIQAIVRNELQAIVNIGGILGFTIGVVQSVYLYFQISGS
ncbi:MAG: DUF445 family protein [Elainellaceae cyanobacterium]